MDILLNFAKRFQCSYAKSNKDKKSLFEQNTMDDMIKFFEDTDTIVDCGMATTGLVVMYLHSLINPTQLDDITRLLIDPKIKDEHFFTIPTDGVVDKNMLLRILPKEEVVSGSKIKIQYFRTNYLQDKLLKLNLGWSSTSWGMWCIELEHAIKVIPDEFLYCDKSSYDDETLYLFFNGKDARFKYNWVVGSKADIKEVTYNTCMRDLNSYLEGFKPTTIKPNSLKEKDILDNVSKSLLNTHRAIIQSSPEILDIQIQPIHTHIIDLDLDLNKIVSYLTGYVNRLMVIK